MMPLDEIVPMVNNYLPDLSYEKAQKVAADGNLNIVTPEDYELFIDIDTRFARSVFETQIKLLSEIEGPGPTGHGVSYKEHFSKSGPPNAHITVYMPRPVSTMERIALQACLGSDVKRELMSVERAVAGNPHPTLFFESQKD